MGLIKKRKRIVGGTADLRQKARAKAAADVAAGEAKVESGDESSIASGKEDAPSTEEDEFFETPDEKRVRLAKELLGKLGESKTPTEVQEQLDQDVALQQKRTRMHIDDIELGEPRLLKGHKLAVTCVCLASDELTAFSGGKDCHVMRWDIETGERDHFPGGRNKFECGGHFSQVLSISLCEPRQTLLSVGTDRVVRLWDPRGPRHSVCRDALLGHSADTTGVAVEEDGNSFYTSSLDKSLKIWDLRRLRCMETLFGHVAGITSLDLAHKGRPLTGGADKTVRLWNIDKETHHLFNKHTYSVDAVTMVDSERFLSGSQDENIHLWSNASKKPLTSTSSGAGWITALRAVRSGNVCFSSALDSQLRCWRFSRGEAGLAGDGPKAEGAAAPGKEKAALKLAEVVKPLPVPGVVNGIAVGKKVLVCAVGKEHRLGRWDYSRAQKNGVLVVPLSYREVDKGAPPDAKP